MSYTPRMRDRFKNLVALLTGAATFASVAAAGTATGLAAHDTALRDQGREQFAEAAQSPQRTVVRTTVIHRVARSGAAAVGPGGTVRQALPVPRPPAPAPPQAPAPSSGS